MQAGTYKFAVSRIVTNDRSELERLEFYGRITADGALELSSDGSWGRFCSAFSPSFRRTEFYWQFMKDLDSVPINAKVHDVRGVLDTTD